MRLALVKLKPQTGLGGVSLGEVGVQFGGEIVQMEVFCLLNNISDHVADLVMTL
jgi:hypothetical protein